MSTGEKPPKRGNGQRGPDRKPRKGSPLAAQGPLVGAMPPDDSPSRARHFQAVEMLCAGKTVKQVANALGVNPSTVYDWIKIPEVRTEYDRLLDEMRDAARDRLRASALVAADSLRFVTRRGEKQHGPRVSAATAILDRVGLTVPKEVKLDVTTNPSAGKADDDLERDVRKAAEALGIAKP